MNNKLKYLAVAGALLFVGGGCGKTAMPADDASADRPAAEQKMPEAPKDDVDKAVDEILDGATGEAVLEEEAAKDAAEVDADQTELNSLRDATYETE